MGRANIIAHLKENICRNHNRGFWYFIEYYVKHSFSLSLTVDFSHILEYN